MTRIEFDGQDINIPQVKMPKLGGRLPRIILGIILLLIIVFTSVYTVEPEEVGIVLRFGEYVRTTEPGLNVKMPFGIESVTKVPVERQLKAEFGFRTVSAGVRSQYATRGLEDESHMLTGDLNAAVVEWVVQFRIVDPYKFLFRVRNVIDTFRAMSEATMRKIVGDRTVNEVLTIGRQEVAAEVKRRLQELCEQYETGIQVDQVVLQDVNPPDEVKASFNDVNEAQQEREKLINQAQSEYNQVIPRAKGEALRTIEQAEGYALDRVNRAQGDSARFVAVYDDYRRAPEVTRRRIYLETMAQILPKVETKYVVDDKLSGILPLLNLNNPTSGE